VGCAGGVLRREIGGGVCDLWVGVHHEQAGCGVRACGECGGDAGDISVVGVNSFEYALLYVCISFLHMVQTKANIFTRKHTMKTTYIRTDLATESPIAEELSTLKGIEFSEEEEGAVHISHLEVTGNEGAELIGKPVGSYITLCFPRLWLERDAVVEQIANVAARELREIAHKVAPGFSRLLVVGLGNRHITPDAIGPLAVEKIQATRHIKLEDGELFRHMGVSEIACIIPGVTGDTGIETAELIAAATVATKPELVILVDALVARSSDRLATTVQITDTGIAPGSGVGNSRSRIDAETLGVPVIAVGVPTVVNSSTLVYDALEKAGIEEIGKELHAVLENGRSFFVSVKESDVATRELATLVAQTIGGL